MTSGGGTEAQVGVMYPAERAPGGAAEFSHCFFHSGGVGRRGGIGSCEVGFEDRDGGTEEKMKVRRVHAAGMHDDVGGSDTGGELEGAFRMQEPESAFLIFPRGRLEKIGGGVTDRGRERTEIVDRGNFNPALLDGTENPRCDLALRGCFLDVEACISDMESGAWDVEVAFIYVEGRIPDVAGW